MSNLREAFLWQSGAGLLIALLCLPLIWGKIPRNRFYGMRTKWSLESDAHWRSANRRGGVWFSQIGFLLAALGAVGFMIPASFAQIYLVGVQIFVALLVIGSTTYLVLTERKTFGKQTGKTAVSKENA